MSNENTLSIPLPNALENLLFQLVMKRRDKIEIIASVLFAALLYFFVFMNKTDDMKNTGLILVSGIPLFFLWQSYLKSRLHKKITSNLDTQKVPTLEFTPEGIKIPFIARCMRQADIELLAYTKIDVMTVAWNKITLFKSCNAPSGGFPVVRSTYAFRLDFETTDTKTRKHRIYLNRELVKEYEQQIIYYVKQHLPLGGKVFKL